MKPYLAEGRVEIPASKYVPAYKENLKALRRNVQVPGFRPGHVPVEYVRSRYGKETLEDLLIKEFFTQLEGLLGEGRIIGLPFYKQEPAKVVTEPPYADYAYSFKALVRPNEPIKVQGPVPSRYHYETAPSDLDLFQRYLRMLLGEGEPLPQLPSNKPDSKELYVKLQLLSSPQETISFSWVSFLEPFPYSYISGRSIGEEVELPPAHLMPYLEVIRSIFPAFSPLSMEGNVKVHIRSAMLFTPASDEKIVSSLNLSEVNEEVWNRLLSQETHRILDRLNERTYRSGFSESAGIEIPSEVVQINYLFYIRSRSGSKEQSFISYEEYAQTLGWRVFLDSHMGHVPDLEVPDEEVEADVWDKFRTRMEATVEGKALLDQIADTEDKKQMLIQGLLNENREDLRRSMRYERFEKWLATTYGPRPDKSIPLQTILLAGL